ncbi:MAG: redoxin domain-containing protein [Thermoanaerobaculia bacterium]
MVRLRADGPRLSLAEARKTHGAVVILFISTICPYSNYYNDLIRDMATAFAKRGVTFVGVNSGTLETAEEARVHAREHGHTFDIIKNPEGRIAGAPRRPAHTGGIPLRLERHAALPRADRLEAVRSGPAIGD